MKDAGNQPLRSARYQCEIRIDASSNRVWQALTAEIDVWWLPDFYVAGPNSTISFDARPGGQLLERTADGGGVLWYTVHACRPGLSLTLVGPLSAATGPGVTTLTLTLEDRDGGCTLTVVDALFGEISDDLIDRLRDGWLMLLGEGLKAHAEHR